MLWLLGVKNAENFWGGGLARLSIRIHSPLELLHKLQLGDLYGKMSFNNLNSVVFTLVYICLYPGSGSKPFTPSAASQTP